jgi:hypothetical protein
MKSALASPKERKRRNPNWKNPVKGHKAKESTLNTKGDFQQFTELMRRIVNKKPVIQ